MGSESLDRSLVITQISVGGFGDDVTAKALLDYLEEKVGMVWRCRLKTSFTPDDSYPDFNVDCGRVLRIADYGRVEPHAFVHFVTSNAAQAAFDAAERGELVLGGRTLKVSLGPQNPHRMNERRRIMLPYKLSDSDARVDIGSMVKEDEFLSGWKGSANMDFLVDPFSGKCRFVFTRDVAFSFDGSKRYAVIKCNIKAEFLVREINDVKRYKETDCHVLLMHLAASPCIYYRTADDVIEETVGFELMDDDDPWIRTTDFTSSCAIGRGNTYRISIPPKKGKILEKALNYLKESMVSVQDHVQGEKLLVKDEPNFGISLSDTLFCIQHEKDVSFKVMFMVNAIMHKGIINQHQISDHFFNLLRNKSEELNLAALKRIYSYKRPIYEASKRLELVQNWLIKNPKLCERPRGLDDSVEVRRLIITPAKAYCVPPELELSNRVLREYKDVADRFMRVTFMDEGMQMINKNVLYYYTATILDNHSSQNYKTSMFKRVKNILTNGFYLCGRKYAFLVFSANQLRDRSAWFFAEDINVKVKDIIRWMGNFTDRNVAKHAARMGQCFSSTYATVEVPFCSCDTKVPDIVKHGYTFSDGIGSLSGDLAAKVASRLLLTDDSPCAYQVRYAGYKGVIARWPSEREDIQLCLRPSMKKFDSSHTVLEICSWTKFLPGFLNRQIITLLSALGVKDDIFWEMQESMLGKLNKMLVDTDVAFDVLTASCAEQGNTAAIMLSAGFRPRSEPHLRGMLTSVRAAQLGDLREKARIFVHRGRWLMGCLDEAAVLEQGQCFIQVSSLSLENSFAKHGDKFTVRKKALHVVTGLVAIAKNPCLHPGDVRILEAVDAPELHHLYDCLVFPQKGERPHSNEASGSDLDGDLYFVTWDDNLLPPSKQSSEPMDYKPGEIKTKPRGVSHADIIEFFTKNMVSESLGAICNAHVVHADLSEDGALDDKCTKLAELAATAVDFPKTGKVVNMPADLKPKLYPDFMGKEEFQSYKSKKILGKLYRRIKDACEKEEAVSGLESMPTDVPYDSELELIGSDAFLEEAWSTKFAYDGQLLGLLGQYNVAREEEVVTGHIWSMPKHSSKKQGELKERLKHAYGTLRKDFRKAFEQMHPGFDQLIDEEKCTLYEKKASAWYQVTYHETWLRKSVELQCPGSAPEPVMLSFPWIAVDYLARIKIRSRGMGNLNSPKPVDSLCKYLADKM